MECLRLPECFLLTERRVERLFERPVERRVERLLERPVERLLERRAERLRDFLRLTVGVEDLGAIVSGLFKI